MSDLISRQAAIEALEKIDCSDGVGISSLKCDAVDDAVTAIKALPSAQPERKRGKWNCSDDMYESAVCSVCGWDTTEPWDHIRHWFNYCPNCGADMKGEQDG